MIASEQDKEREGDIVFFLRADAVGVDASTDQCLLSGQCSFQGSN
jgi:hypothetical protein